MQCKSFDDMTDSLTGKPIDADTFSLKSVRQA